MAKLAIGVDLGATKIISALIDLSGKILKKGRINTEAQLGRTRVQENLLLAIEGVRNGEAVGIGVGSPGQIDFRTGVVIGATPNISDWIGVNIKSLVEKRFNLQCIVDNDVNAMLLGEYAYGAGRGFRDLVGITLGTGVGGALILGGELYRGHAFAATEIGHMSINFDGIPCGCGGVGCIEEYGSGRAMVREAKRLIEEGETTSLTKMTGGNLSTLTAELISQAHRAGDELATRVIEQVGTWIGYGVANLINLLNPERVIVGGGLAKIGEVFFRFIRNGARERALLAGFNTTDIVPTELDDHSALLGAASLVWMEMMRK